MTAVLTIVPVFLLILLGQVCRRTAFPGDGFWAPAEKLTYYALLPALLVVTLAGSRLPALPVVAMSGTLIAAVTVMTALALALRRPLALKGPAFTSFYQALIRQNTYIGLAIAFGLRGAPGLEAAAVAVGVLVFFGNVFSVIFLAGFGQGRTRGGLATLRLLAVNPLILACLTGIALNLSGLGLAPLLEEVLRILGRAALPLGLLAVGAALDLAAMRTAPRVFLAAAGLKLLVLPAMTWLFGLAFGLSGPALEIAVLFNALPVASSAYILARQLGGDAPLMAGLCTVQTLLGTVSLPLVLTLLAGHT